MAFTSHHRAGPPAAPPGIANEPGRKSIGRGWRRLRPGLVRIVRRGTSLILLLGLALRVRRERRALLAMNDRMLKDIGLDRGALCAESRRSFWDIPSDRQRL
ncbi:MAG: DUF1127 domain-containing protein [Hyphomicrobiaceae bacterium]|nr:DUF1127 domain-containing protein [Hyphomicrobiaceae bacterium]